MRQFVSLFLVFFVLSACNLSKQATQDIEMSATLLDETEASIEQATSTIAPSDTPTASTTPIVENTALPVETTSSSSQNIRNIDNCVVRDDLPTYTVSAGDTLSSIAERHGSTISQLTELNCLTDSNLIRVGMNLHVPNQLRITSTSALASSPNVSPTPHNLGVRGTLSIYPADQFEPNWSDYFVEPETPVTIEWTGIEPEYYANIVSSTFYFTPSAGASSQLGIDSDMSDGISLTWTPYGVEGVIQATAMTDNNAFWMSSSISVHMKDEIVSESDDGCQFRFTQTGDVYAASNTTSNVVASGIAADGTDYTILDLIITGEGMMVKIELNDNLPGWVAGINGTVNCD